MNNNRATKMTIGILMVLAGFLKLSTKIVISSGLFSSMTIFGMHIGGGIFMLPIILGIILLFAGGRKLRILSPFLMGGGMILMLLFGLMTAHVRLRPMNIYSWLVLLVLIFGGLGLMIGGLFGKDEEPETKTPTPSRTDYDRKFQKMERSSISKANKSEKRLTDIDDELEKMKKKM